MQDSSLTVQRNAQFGVKMRRLRLLLFVGSIMLQSNVCQAGNYLLITSGEGEIYNRFQVALNKNLKEINPGNSLTSSDITALSTTYDTKRFDAVVSAGIEASKALTRFGIKNHILMSMLPETSYQNLAASGMIDCDRNNCHVIYLDQPVERQLRLIRAALPNARTITVIGSERSRALREHIATSATKFGFRIKNMYAGSETMLLNALQDELDGTDVLMAIPDPIIYNSNTARAILLSTFNQRIPLFAYSRSFIRAGATFGIYSSPEDIARQAAELLCCLDKIKADTLYPKYFTIDINPHTTEALGISIQNAISLKQAIAGHEK